MKFRILILLLLTMLMVPAEASVTYRYRVFFTDKTGSEVCQFSERALERRENREVAIDSTDYVVSPLYLDSLKAAGLQIVVTSRWMNTAVVMQSNGGRVADSVFQKMPFVASWNQITSTEYFEQPRRRELPAHETVTNETFRTPIYEVKGEALLDSGYCGQGMLIAVLDGGFMNVNIHDNVNQHVIGWCDMYNPTDTVGAVFFGSEAHGANCLSIMSAPASSGVWGTAPEADYFLIRTENSPSETPLEEDMWIAGAEMADSIGADLISSSLGYYEFDNYQYNHTQSQLGKGEVFISQAADIGSKKGMLICCAAGNEGGTSWNAIDFPADVMDVFTVGASTSSLTAAYFTSPGFTHPYVKPDVACRGQNSFLIDAYSGTVSRGSGTSYATPMMCGLCASLWSAVPQLSVQQLRNIIRRSANQAMNPDNLMGFGMPDFQVALQRARALYPETSLRGVESMSVSEEAPMTDLWGRPVRHLEQNQGGFVQKGGKIILFVP